MPIVFITQTPPHILEPTGRNLETVPGAGETISWGNARQKKAEDPSSHQNPSKNAMHGGATHNPSTGQEAGGRQVDRGLLVLQEKEEHSLETKGNV